MDKRLDSIERKLKGKNYLPVVIVKRLVDRLPDGTMYFVAEWDSKKKQFVPIKPVPYRGEKI